jgi:pimeloyl-ACP methyl ester carboxylesterase
MHPLIAILFLFSLPLIHACTSVHQTSQPLENQQTGSSLPAYEQLHYWAAHPLKHDPSDSTPLPYLPVEKDSSVNVFFIHPTTFTSKKAIANKPYTTSYWNASLLHQSLNIQTDNSTILNQASAFNRYPVYAPRYRQAHLQSFYLPDSIAAPFFDTAYADIKSAFLYFLHHHAGQKPFIIASHSQGTLHAGRLIRELIEGKALAQKMIAAYIVGLAVPEHYFEQLPPCTKPDQTGCFVTWRTFKRGYVPQSVKEEKFKSVVVNPVSWTTDTLFVPRSQQLGAVLFKFNKPSPANVSTQIHGNVLWSTKPRFAGNIFFTTKNYHIGDINLFWKDIRNNVDTRVRAYQQQFK